MLEPNIIEKDSIIEESRLQPFEINKIHFDSIQWYVMCCSYLYRNDEYELIKNYLDENYYM